MNNQVDINNQLDQIDKPRSDRNSVQVMMDEHQNILIMLKIVRNACIRIFNGEEINYEDFADMVDFIKNYADKHHHNKEEKFLFKEMQTRLGAIGEKLITNGMLVEHDLGRLYVMDLLEALDKVKAGDNDCKVDVISAAISYTKHLTRHIQKEDEVIYKFGETKLSKEIMDEIDEKSRIFEEECNDKGIQEKYITLLTRLEDKYVVK